ncbi:hypothetical protein FDUTEX481_08321 [Tolypothrix sp. PCC 7601]|nr:hypothetical protein FDUTEX481_08321 [Tolypothrix sp. PCC 7601]
MSLSHSCRSKPRDRNCYEIVDFYLQIFILTQGYRYKPENPFVS